MGGTLSVQNNTGVDLLITLSQVGPLHWKTIKVGATERINCGQVWFTVNANLDNGKEPTTWDVAKPFVLGGAASVAAVCTLGGALVAETAAVAVIGAAGAVTSAVTAAGGLTQMALAHGDKQKEDLYSVLVEHWTVLGASEASAKFLAKNSISKVVPAHERGVYADGKTISIVEELVNDEQSGMAILKLKIVES